MAWDDEPTEEDDLKDAVLDRVAEHANVAQFVSFGPGPEPVPRYARVFGDVGEDANASVGDAVRHLLANSPEGTVNLRTFRRGDSKSSAFLYGIADPEEVIARVREFTADGFYVIVNETIDVNDGGVSGVSYAGILEFAPDDTPRAVEKPGTAALSRREGLDLLEQVYRFRPDLPENAGRRVEFSIHPLRRGFRHEHTVIWEEEAGEDIDLEARLTWPNRFSRLVGDKVYGLLIADVLGAPVPRTLVISRKVAPFSFGSSTSTHEVWVRTAPAEQVPGHFATQKGWTDPFALLEREDPASEFLASVAVQAAVETIHAGAAAFTASGDLMIEGVMGEGDAFMMGSAPPSELPPNVTALVQSTAAQMYERLGPSRFEWAYDGSRVWILQLHSGAIPSHGLTIYPGEPVEERQFAVEQGLPALRALASELEGTNVGVVLLGNVGITSHFGDVLRRARVPSRMSPQ